ncbi:MAG TPA: hypothetical protein VGN78_09935, partial [Solirubrobacteraceae bacterium]|nr:hypothetical protein [Solirubrobacteraceae bacterium]
DGGSYFTNGGAPTTSCSDYGHEVYDCNLDDYFNPSPAPGNYLYDHWNLFNSAFLCEAATCGSGTTSGGEPPIAPPPPPVTVVNPPPTAKNPPAEAAFTSSTLARAVGLLRAAARVAVRASDARAALRVGRAYCPNVCRGSLSLYVLRGLGVGHTLSIGRMSFSLRPGQSADLRVPIPAKVRRLLRRNRRLNASLALTANRVTVTRRFTLRAA